METVAVTMQDYCLTIIGTNGVANVLIVDRGTVKGSHEVELVSISRTVDVSVLIIGAPVISLVFRGLRGLLREVVGKIYVESYHKKIVFRLH